MAQRKVISISKTLCQGLTLTLILSAPGSYFQHLNVRHPEDTRSKLVEAKLFSSFDPSFAERYFRFGPRPH